MCVGRGGGGGNRGGGGGGGGGGESLVFITEAMSYSGPFSSSQNVLFGNYQWNLRITDTFVFWPFCPLSDVKSVILEL